MDWRKFFRKKKPVSDRSDDRLRKVPPLSQSQINAFVKKHGKHSERVLDSLGKEQAFYNAITSDLGQELLKDSLSKMEEYLDMIVNEAIIPRQLAEYRVLRCIVLQWSNRIDSYLTKINEIERS